MNNTDLKKIIAEAEALSVKYADSVMPDAEKEKYNKLMKDGAELSDRINEQAAQAKSMERMRAAQKYLGEVPNPTLPAPAAKTEATAGYITVGDFLTTTKAWQSRLTGGGRFAKDFWSVDVPSGLLPIKSKLSAGLVSLTHEEIKTLNATFETKDLPSFGSRVIAPDRVDRFVFDTRPDVLTLRDVLTVSPTSSNTIEYVAEDSYTSGADIQSEGTTEATTGAKGTSDIAYVVRTATVRTIATTLPISEQQLADAPALVNRINARLLHDVRKKEEQLMGYGSGSGLEFAGFFDTDSGVAAASTPSGSPTLIDKIRAAATDVMVAGYNPGFVWIHPTDWEAIELERGSDGQFVWAIIRDTLGPRIWSMRVVQGVGTQKVGANTRNVLVGDTIGAVLYDREQANIAVGWVDDQFTHNLRTIRAEERMVLCVDAPAAFAKINTVA